MKDKKNDLSVCLLASGSRGNACCVTTGDASILIDAGLSGKEIEKRMNSRGLCPQTLKALVVTHEHIDHTRGVGVLARRFNLPVFINSRTYAATGEKLGKISDLRFFECGTGFSIGDLNIHPFSISHDASDPAGFTVGGNGRSMGIATDLGIATAVVKEHMRGCDLIVIEANHDPVMLENGPYPWPLKQRVKSRLGHLSNDESGEFIMEIRTEALSHVILGHLSGDNNTPEIARATVESKLNGSNINLIVASQDHATELIDL